MDPNSTPQTVAQAVQAATQQAQQAVSHASPPPPLQNAQSSTVDNLTCQWQGCGERCDSAESLYDHVCETHVGRKSTNNLNLTCQWGACRTTTVKRDHITSHIRVHVPLKPHKCDFCTKAFKRPQDLKKHVKTHADDSVLMNSPQSHNGRGGMPGNGGMGHQNGKREPNYSYYPASHDTSMGNPYPTFQPNMNAGGPPTGAYPQHSNPGQYAGYGSVSYPNSSAVADIQSMDTRRRALEALNDFLGDIKRRAIDPNQYYDVGQRLQGTALPLPVGNGYNTGYNNNGGYNNFSHAASLLESFNNGTSTDGGHGSQAGIATQGYSLPLRNARTKDDLTHIDRFLEQLQATVYENSNAAAAAGIQHPAVHETFVGDLNLGHAHTTQYRSSHSPPQFQQTMTNGGMGGFGTASTGSVMQGLTSVAPSNDTPALTPSSYASAQSPRSTQSRASFGSSNGNMYPNLPSVTGVSDMGSNYPGVTSAPTSGLASGFDGIDARRYSGGRLQRQAPSHDAAMGGTDDLNNHTPRASDRKRSKSKGNSSIDPALRGEDEKSSESASTPIGNSDLIDDKRQEEWVENIRVIEALRSWIADRIRTGDFENAEHDLLVADDDNKSPSDVDMKTVETAKMVAEKLAGVENAAKQSDETINYPSLPNA